MKLLGSVAQPSKRGSADGEEILLRNPSPVLRLHVRPRLRRPRCATRAANMNAGVYLRGTRTTCAFGSPSGESSTMWWHRNGAVAASHRFTRSMHSRRIALLVSAGVLAPTGRRHPTAGRDRARTPDLRSGAPDHVRAAWSTTLSRKCACAPPSGCIRQSIMVRNASVTRTERLTVGRSSRRSANNWRRFLPSSTSSRILGASRRST